MQIIFTSPASHDIDEVEHYILKKWNEEVLFNFREKLDYVISLVCERNVIFQKYENTQYHKILITKHNTLIYKIEEDTLFIIRILQNFQNPEENFKSLT